MRPILSLDFDGVIHSYKSGWRGPRCIPDEPVPGALEFIVKALKVFDVQIYSSRSNYWGGRRAMKRWLRWNCIKLAPTYDATPEWLRGFIDSVAPMEGSWDEDAKWGVIALVGRIKFPKHKPPALVTLDDRALTFTGEWPDPAALLAFKPWYKA